MLACVVCVVFGGRVLGAELEPGQKYFLVKFTVLEDQRGANAKPTVQEIQKRFVVKLSNNYVERNDSPIGGEKAIIGVIKEGSTFDLSYKTDSGEVMVFKNALAWDRQDAKGDKELTAPGAMSFSPPNSPVKHFQLFYTVKPNSTQPVREMDLYIGICGDEGCKGE